MNPSYPSLWTPLPTLDTLKPHQPPPDFCLPSYDNNRPTSLADIGVAEILERYKHDTDLLKHILIAKAEEDKRRAAEEVRLAEEARLQQKYLDIIESSSQHSRRTSDLIEGFDPMANEASQQCWFNNGGLSLMATSLSLQQQQQSVDKTPPSPSPTNFIAPLSPYTFDVPFEQLTISSSSPELAQRKVTSTPPPPGQDAVSEAGQQQQQQQEQKNSSTMADTDKIAVPPSPPPVPASPRERPCKRTLSRTRSQRKGPPKTSNNKRNKRVTPQPLPQPPSQLSDENPAVEDEAEEDKGAAGKEVSGAAKDQEPHLDHGKVMEALRAKIQRSALLQPREASLKQEEQEQQQPNSMSPTGILLLDLKNPHRKSFPTRKPHVATVRKPRPFASAHNYCDASTKKEAV
ncbi:hypothetical protein BX666DRAFT_2125936 [Dichotomocladium elegans]|nr:hypothetical protein BX666DRAFT_2125936 [Dichotomocladium elegans]